MTSDTFDGALAEERTRGEERLAAERAKWFRAGLEAAADAMDRYHAPSGNLYASHLIRSIPVPEDV